MLKRYQNDRIRTNSLLNDRRIKIKNNQRQRIYNERNI